MCHVIFYCYAFPNVLLPSFWWFSILPRCWRYFNWSYSVIYNYFSFLSTVLCLILCEVEIIFVYHLAANVACYFCKLFLYSLACWSYVSAYFDSFIFFIVWNFKLWRKGGRIGFNLVDVGFCVLLDLCLCNTVALFCFLYFSWVL